MSVDKFRVIEEVRKRPLLWDWQDRTGKRDPTIFAPLWVEIGQVLNANAYVCKLTWSKLRLQLRTEVKRIPSRIARAKERGEYDPNKKYCSWMYFEALEFLLDWQHSVKARSSTNSGYDSDSDVEIVDENDAVHTQLDLSKCTSLQTGIDNNIPIVDCDNLDKMQTKKQRYVNNCYKSDNDIDSLAEDKLDETQCRKENSIYNLSLKESRNQSLVISIEDSNDTVEDPNFKKYAIPLNTCKQDDECGLIYNNDIALQSDSVVKTEAELQIESEHYPEESEYNDDRSSTISANETTNCSENFDFSEALDKDEHYDLVVEHVPSISGTKREQNEYPDSSVLPDEQISNSPGLSDEDYSFLHSFLSQTKAMTQLQKMEFRLYMKNLLVKIFPASGSVNILEKQLLLPDDNDPDRKFLISFWPFIKSMTLMQNLQFRIKMAELVYQILSGEAK